MRLLAQVKAIFPPEQEGQPGRAYLDLLDARGGLTGRLNLALADLGEHFPSAAVGDTFDLDLTIRRRED